MSVEETLNAAVAFAESAAKSVGATEVFAGLGQVAEKATQGFAKFQDQLLGTGNDIEKLEHLTSAQVKQFGILSAALIGTSERFRDMGGNIMTISSQYDDLHKKLGEGPGAIAKLVQAGANTELAKSMAGIMDLFGGMAESVVKGADNALALRGAYMSLAASTGDLGKVYDSSGQHLENINEVVSNQAMLMADAAEATNLPIQTMQAYYAELGKIPGALTSVVRSTGQFTGNLDMLTASTRLAHGTGRDLKEVATDLTAAYTNYGLQGENALKFTARFTEISSKFQVQLGTIRTELTEVSKKFRDFANEGEAGNKMAEGAAAIMNNYMDSLKSTGITGEKATQIIGNMTRHMGDLNIAQKAFLSAQTGGPGGLMGGFQIEQMLQKGDIEGVFEKAKQTMQKQFGSIVTLDDATKSESAAAQLQKQITMLRQGPLGQFVTSDQDAMRVLQGFKTGEKTSAPTKLKDDVLQTTMDKGLDYEKQSATELSSIRALLERSELLGGFANLRTLQGGGLTAGSGTKEESTDKAKAARDQIAGRMTQAASRGGTLGERLKVEHGKEDMAGSVDSGVLQNVKDYKTYIQGLDKAVGAIQSTLAPIFGKEAGVSVEEMRKREAEATMQAAQRRQELEKAGDTRGVRDLDARMLVFHRTIDEAAKKAEASAAKGSDPSKATVTAVAPATTDPLKSGILPVALPGGATAPGSAPAPAKPGDVARAGMQPPPKPTAPAAVGAAASAAASRTPAAPATAPAGASAAQPVSHKIEVTGKVEGFCLKCQRVTDQSQLAATASGTKAEN